MNKQEQERTIFKNMGLSDVDILELQVKNMLYDTERLIMFSDSQKVMKTRWDAFKSILLLVNGVNLNEIEEKFPDVKPKQEYPVRAIDGRPPMIFKMLVRPNAYKDMTDEEIIGELGHFKSLVEKYPDIEKQDSPEWFLGMLDFLSIHSDAFGKGQAK